MFWRRGIGLTCGQALQLGMIRHGMAGIPKIQAFSFNHGGLRCGQAVPVHGQQPRVAQEHIQRRSGLAGLRVVCAGSDRGGSIRSGCDNRRCAEQMGHMAGQLVGSAPVAGEQAYDVLPRRVNYDHRGIGTLVRKQGGKRAHGYARCADEGMRRKIFIGCRQQGADFFKGCNTRRAKP